MAIKEFFKSLTTSVKTATNTAVSKIDATVDVQKLRYRITKKEEEISEVYKKLGEKIVSSVYAEENFDESVSEAIAQIEELKEEIAILNAERISKENHTICDSCGEEISLKNDYCPKCGNKISESPIVSEDEDEQPACEE